VIVAAFAVGGAPVEIWASLAVALGLAVVGFVDDRRPLPPTTRLAFEALGGLLLYVAGARAMIGPDWLDPVFVVLWFVAVVNAFNMIDNHDAICASLGALAGLGAGVIAALAGADAVAVLGIALGGAAIGFLRWNLPPASIFLGDTGSMFVGAVVGATVLWLPELIGSSLQRLTVAALLLLVPFLDEGSAIISRVREGRGPMMASTDHLTHRLRRRGLTPRQIVATLALLQLAAAIAAVAISRITGLAAIAAAAAVCLTAGIALLVTVLRMPHPSGPEDDPGPGR
jgi:UDP-GlcNAc:undecaprenyl-phosphate GlcNAc-1-phosphate transferase